MQALALEKESVGPFKDETLPDKDTIFFNAGNAIKDFNEVTFVEQAELKPEKRKREPGTSSTSVKKPKLNPEDAEDDAAILTAIKSDTLSSWTVPMLKKCIQRKGEKIRGKKKEDYVDQVIALYD